MKSRVLRGNYILLIEFITKILYIINIVKESILLIFCLGNLLIFNVNWLSVHF